MRLRISYDEKLGASLYLRLSDAEVVESEELKPGVVLDFNGKGQVVGIEILNLKGDDAKQLEVVLPDDPA
jgi:uncharacterized protein YuzE